MSRPKIEIETLKSWLVFLIFIVAAAHLIFVGGGFLFGWRQEDWLVRLFNVDNEYNFPTLVSTLMLLAISAVSLRLHQVSQKHDKLAWLLVALLFAYMATDELFVLHERMALPVREILAIDLDSPFYHAWIIPAAAAGFLALLGVYRLSATVNKILRLRFIELMVLYVLGVIAFEMLGTFLFDNQALYYTLIVLAEETFELALQAAILFALYRHLLGAQKHGSRPI